MMVDAWIDHSPKYACRAVCVTVIACPSGVSSAPYKSTTNAVIEHINQASKYPPSVWTRPCLTGWVTDAAAPAFGAEPRPPWPENTPRRMHHRTAVTAPASAD